MDIQLNITERFEYDLPHAPNRHGQRETIEWLLGLPNGTVAALNAPTGSGKTSFPAAVSTKAKALALVKTKSLQVENYGKGYGFSVMKGKGNYECDHPEAMDGATANECLFGAPTSRCPVACDYLHAKQGALSSDKTSLNYAYWLSSAWPREQLVKVNKAGEPGYLFCDEAHQMSDITLDWASCTVTMRQRMDWDLPPFPVLHGYASREDMAQAVGWLTAAVTTIGNVVAPLRAKRERFNDDPTPENALGEEERQTLIAGEKLLGKIGTVDSALADGEGAWYLRGGPGALNHAGVPVPGLVFRPLTARYHFGAYFLNKAWRTVLMSATLGDPLTLSEELGLPVAGFVYRNIPNQWDANTRPIRILDAPAMGQKTRNDEAAQMKQAQVMADAILGCPPDWGGIIHVTRKTEAYALAKRLALCGVPSARLWTPRDTDSTDWQLRSWNTHKRARRGAIAITWAWWEGYNGLDEKICIVAKTPFPNIADDYERARMQYSGAFYLQRTAWNLEQACGRTRRGRDVDYDTPNGERRGLVAIADGNWSRCQKYLSADFSSAVVMG